MELPANVIKYFKKFGLNGWNIEIDRSQKFDNIIVIPSLGEYENIGKTIESIANSDSTHFHRSLILIIVNNTQEVDQLIKLNNEKTIAFIREKINASAKIENGISLAFIDASSPGLELDSKHGGVGLARKIAMDLSLTLFDYSNDRKKLMICCDADCEVSSNYLTAIVDFFNNNNANAGYIKFEHPTNDETEETRAIVCYELFLHYYVLSLQYAKSPYGIHTIGSTMICNHEAYINIQGMNKRKAAEDFYFMEKLAKSYKIFPISNAAIYPSGRGSWRVPFGTGQRVNRFLTHELNEYQLYSPKSFDMLKQWNEFYYNPLNNDLQKLLEFSKSIDDKLFDFLYSNSFQKDFEKILANSRAEKQLQQQKRWWFDGFKTLKLIHWLRDEKYPNINMFDAIDELLVKVSVEKPVNRIEAELPSLNDQKKYLLLLRNLT